MSLRQDLHSFIVTPKRTKKPPGGGPNRTAAFYQQLGGPIPLRSLADSQLPSIDRRFSALKDLPEGHIQ